MSRDLVTFPLTQNAKLKLSNCGFITTEDLEEFKPSELARETGLTAEEALDVLKIVFPEKEKKADILSCSAYDILTEEKNLLPISTSSSAIDNILGGGIPVSKVTELCGCPGSGKTQLCMQLCTNVTKPEDCGGLEGEAFFIDSEGSFIIQRLAQIASSGVKNCKYRNKDATSDDIKIKNVLRNIYYYPCKSYTEVIARVHLLHKFLEKHKKTRLIIIDSITFHFRYGFDGSYSLRTRLLNGIVQVLVKIAHDYKVAVVLTNQMTTKIEADGSSHLIPALGESWGHACTVRLILSWTEERKRQAHLLKSPSMPECSASYKIDKDGIKDEDL